MAEQIADFAQIAGRYRALFCDLWGCVHNGVAPFPGAVAALQAFRRDGGLVILVSNAPRPKGSVALQLDRLGVPRDAWDDIATSGDAAQFALVSGAVGRRVYHIGAIPKDDTFFTDLPPELRDHPAIERVPLDQAEGIVCTGPFDDQTDQPDDYRATFLAAKTRGLKLLCANPDIEVDYGDRRIWCAGALAQYYDQMGGESLYFGKPHPPIYDVARRRIAALGASVQDDEILCIGDGVLTDVQGAMAEGLDCLFLTEGLAAGKFGADGALDMPKLNDWLEGQQRTAVWAMGMLR